MKNKLNKNGDFFYKVLEIVRKIPEGKVTTYGAIGEALGMRSSARMVGWALNSVAGNMEIPCHRVVNRNGELSGKIHFATPHLMEELLESEGVALEEGKVDLSKYLWEPKNL